ncbi:MAG: hypothetical protein ACP5NF_10150, partial [Thermoanaerobaculum sp.]
MKWRFSLALLVAGSAPATTIVPPENLGELAQHAQVVVLAQSLQQEVRPRGPLRFTVTRFRVLEAVKGSVPETLEVEVPGGSFGERTWSVPGFPKFQLGEVYLLFLDMTPRGTWVPKVASYGILRRVLGTDGSHLLTPLDEEAGLETFPRADGILPETPEVYGELKLLAHIKDVLAGKARWDRRQVVAPRQVVPLKARSFAPPGACTYITSPYPRWPYNTPSPPGTVVMYAQDTGDPSYPNAFTAVASAIAMWMGIPGTSLSLAYGGPVAYTLPCTSGQDTPGPDDPVVVFNDPCGDIADPPCPGVLAFGGPWWSGTHTFDGMSWGSIVSWFVVVNNGAGCIGTPGYQ